MKKHSLGPKGPDRPKRRETSQAPTRVSATSLYNEVLNAAKEDLAEYKASLSSLQDGGSAADLDLRHFLVDNLDRTLFKKFRGRGPVGQPSEKTLRQLANDAFLAQNERCRKLDANWSALSWTHFSPVTQVLLGEIQCILSDWLRWVDELIGSSNSWLSYGAFGPGSAVGAHHEDVWAKMADLWPDELTAPSDSAAAEFAAWVYSEFGKSISKPRVAAIRCSNLDSVEKTAESRRSIGIPTVVSSWGSRALGILMEITLKQLGFSIKTQPDRNARLAWLGSVSKRADKPATIDMHASSDSYYGQLLAHGFYFLPELWEAMCRYRDSTIAVSETEKVDLHIFSTMGNGFTFPLQTVWYLAAVTAVYRISGRNPETKICDPVTALPIREIGVFGDDIILASDLAPVLISFLEEVGFVVNVEKSHYSRDGLFRESCGADWYRGNFVRGTYFKSFNTDADRVISFNQILLWSLEHSIPMKRTLSALKNGIPPWRKNRVPFYEQDDAGLKQPGNSYPRGVLKGLGCFSYESDYIYRAFRPVKRIREVFPRVASDPTDHVVVELSARCESITQETQSSHLYGKEPRKPSTYFVDHETACFFQKFVSVGLIDDRIVSVRSPAYMPVRYREEYVAVPSMTAPPARIKGSRTGISIDTTSPELVWSRHGSWSALISAYQRIYGIW